MPRVPFTDEDDSLPTVTAQRGSEPAGGAVRVRVTAGSEVGATSAGPTVMVGRSPGADLRLSDPLVSAFHVEVAMEGGWVRVRDLGSRNGTIFQGARVGVAHLPPGASLQVGSTVLRVEADTKAAPRREEADHFGDLRGKSAAMRQLFALLMRLAPTELSVLIEGPTGTGKELVARGLHAASRHAGGPFVVLDCTAIPAGLAESILFGHEKGAFTGATERRPGVFEAADAGTVFLDEVGELSPELQPKLLRVLERREVVRVGGTRPQPVQARVVAASWRDLRAQVTEGRFREDLYFRLAQARVALPPLRERIDDLPLLVQHFLASMAPGVPCARAIAPEAMAELGRREWPGNVRELKNAVERAALLASDDVILPSDLSFERRMATERARESAAPPPPDSSALPLFKEAKRTLIDEFERDYLQRLLQRSGNNLSRASALAGVERHHLRELLRKHGLREDALTPRQPSSSSSSSSSPSSSSSSSASSSSASSSSCSSASPPSSSS